MKGKKSRNKKYLIIGLSLILVFLVLFSTKLNPLRLLSSIYNVEDVDTSIGKIKLGDIIHYDLNGYSNWQVIYIDKKNNTLDVVSKTNTEDITLTTEDDYKNALNIFQETADKYVDGKYAIKARSVSRTDLDNFAFDEEFWNADIYDGAVAYTNGAIKYNGLEDNIDKYYILPLVYYTGVTDYNNYNIGDDFNLSAGGINEWIVADYPGSENIWLIPKVPFEVSFSDPEFAANPDIYIYNLYQNIKNDSDNIESVRNYSNVFNIANLFDTDELKNHYKSVGDEFNIIVDSINSNIYDNYQEYGFSIYNVNYVEDTSNCCNWHTHRNVIPVTKGFRPVVTFKYSDKLVDGKNLSTDLEIGDYVNYKALGYNNWRVLSIDEDNNTVDIISGGIVKNIYLYGENDFENYEDLLQSEVDTYKVGDNVISARPVEYNDIINLNKMKDDVNAKYWSYEKKEYNKSANDETSSAYATNGYYDASIMYYDVDEAIVKRKWVSLFISSGMSSGNSSVLSNYNGMGDLSFTAGIRPVITVKLDTVEKIDDNSKNEIIDESKINDRKINNEQNINDNNHITNDNQNRTNSYYNISNGKKDDKTNELENIDDNIEEVNNYYNSGNKAGSKNKLVKYIIIAIVVLNIAIIGQVILSLFIIKNMKKIKVRKKKI